MTQPPFTENVGRQAVPWSLLFTDEASVLTPAPVLSSVKTIPINIQGKCSAHTKSDTTVSVGIKQMCFTGLYKFYEHQLNNHHYRITLLPFLPSLYYDVLSCLCFCLFSYKITIVNARFKIQFLPSPLFVLAHFTVKPDKLTPLTV